MRNVSSLAEGEVYFSGHPSCWCRIQSVGLALVTVGLLPFLSHDASDVKPTTNKHKVTWCTARHPRDQPATGDRFAIPEKSKLKNIATISHEAAFAAVVGKCHLYRRKVAILSLYARESDRLEAQPVCGIQDNMHRRTPRDPVATATDP